MTRPKNQEAIEKEARLQEAMAAVLAKKHTAASATLAFNISRSTLYDRLNGKPPRNKAHETEQLLSHAEEKELVQWITRLTITGYPPRYDTLREMAEEIRKRRVKNINQDGLELVKYDDIGKQWVPRFLRRHPELASVRPRSIDAVRIKDTSPERLQRWFDDLEKAVMEYNIKPKNMYNMDESGFAIGEKEAGRCIINAQVRQKFQAKPGRQEWVSVVECICADGNVVPPLVIFRAENLSRQWIPASIHGNWSIGCNSKGWTSNIHGMQWLRQCFEPATRDKAGGEYRLLICDGHDSHITGEWVAHCMDNNIILAILPPHSSHLTQPLDVGVFGSLRNIWQRKSILSFVSA
jgi:DDE superfamily endonuclease/Tc5 transposase DNA-binding domain